MDKFQPGILRTVLADVKAEEAVEEIVTGAPVDKWMMSTREKNYGPGH